jgi:uncharacterized protein YebE (UPF0316 family)
MQNTHEKKYMAATKDLSLILQVIISVSLLSLKREKYRMLLDGALPFSVMIIVGKKDEKKVNN